VRFSALRIQHSRAVDLPAGVPEKFVKLTASAAVALIGSQPSATAPTTKRKYTKRKDAPSTEADEEEKKSTKKKSDSTEAAVLSTPKSHLLSPASALTPTSMAASPSASPSAGSAAAAAATTSPAPSLAAAPRLMRSPSTAALPSALTQGEKLRARIVHFLAAQPRGLPMSTLRNRLEVLPEDMKSTLSMVAKYESPGYYDLKRELYAEIQIESWQDYTVEDRKRVVAKMQGFGMRTDRPSKHTSNQPRRINPQRSSSHPLLHPPLLPAQPLSLRPLHFPPSKLRSLLRPSPIRFSLPPCRLCPTSPHSPMTCLHRCSSPPHLHRLRMMRADRLHSYRLHRLSSRITCNTYRCTLTSFTNIVRIVCSASG
jgi:hypothetical protein